jgi:hypothetical protein
MTSAGWLMIAPIAAPAAMQIMNNAAPIELTGIFSPLAKVLSFPLVGFSQ